MAAHQHYSDLAAPTYAVVLHRTFGWKLPHEAKTRRFFLERQKSDGAFVNVAGTVDPDSAAGKAYNTTMALMALRALGEKPRHDPLPVFAAVLEEDYKKLPLYMTSFFPMAYRCAGRLVPRDADQQEAAATPIDKADARSGDLVCFGEPGHADHIAFWLGDGRILHATGREGVNAVVEEPLENLGERQIRFARLTIF